MTNQNNGSSTDDSDTFQFDPDPPADDDTLGREPLAQNIAQTIHRYDREEPLTIGILGPWGSGKTTLLNMVVDDIEDAENDGAAESDWTVYQFNPWLVSGLDDLILSFLRGLAEKLDTSLEGELGSDIADAMAKYGKALTLGKFIPGAGELAKEVVENWEELQDEIKTRSEQKLTDPAHLKNQLDETLRDSEVRLLVAIDDIDRLTHQEIARVFQLIRAVADFPRTVFLVACDRSVVANALNTIHQDAGNDFLGKIVQVPFSLPSVPSWRLKESFRREVLRRPAGHQYWTEYRWNEPRFTALWQCCLSKHYETLRDIKRMKNVVPFRYQQIEGEVDPLDFAIVETLRDNDRKLYTYIEKHPELTNAAENWAEDEESNRSTYDKDIIEQKCKTIEDELGPDRLITLKRLFPEHFRPDKSYRFHRDRGLDDENYYHRFFALEVAPTAISEAAFNSIFEELRDNSRTSQPLQQWLDDKPHGLNGFIDRLLKELEDINDFNTTDFPVLPAAEVLGNLLERRGFELDKQQMSRISKTWMTLIGLAGLRSPDSKEEVVWDRLEERGESPTLGMIRHFYTMLETPFHAPIQLGREPRNKIKRIFLDGFEKKLVRRVPDVVTRCLAEQPDCPSNTIELFNTFYCLCSSVKSARLVNPLVQAPTGTVRDLARCATFTFFRICRDDGTRRDHQGEDVLEAEIAYEKLKPEVQNALDESLENLKNAEPPQIPRQLEYLWDILTDEVPDQSSR